MTRADVVLSLAFTLATASCSAFGAWAARAAFAGGEMMGGLVLAAYSVGMAAYIARIWWPVA